MLSIKVPLKKAEQVKKELIDNGLFDREHQIKKQRGFVYFPVKKRFKADYTFVNIAMKKRVIQTNLKKSLSQSKKIDKKELESLRRSMDIIGNIAILEIPDELEKKETLIAKEVLKINKNIKTVLRKGKHEGVFRVQKLGYLAGENTKEAIYKENNVIMKLDVEQVYFSPRLASERKRIMQLIKKPENVMVMFSGCAPYVCVIAKNTPAKYVYGIEINPVAHRYGWENLKLNKIENAFLINEDVKTALPHFYQKILGLKSAIKPEEMESRLKHNPLIMEIHTFESDFYENFENLKKNIRALQEAGKYVVVHQPLDKKKPFDLIKPEESMPVYDKMLELVKEFRVQLIIHPVNRYSQGTEDELAENMKKIGSHQSNIFFENHPGYMFTRKEDILSIIKKSGMQNMCIDTCHLLYHYSGKELVELIKEIQKLCNTYFHINDYKDNVHGAKLDEHSRLPLQEVLPLVTKGVVEVTNVDEQECNEMISSWKYLDNFQKTFDRIIMPLPKSAADYLDVALAATRKGTTIHFYDFQKEGEFEKSVEKIRKACESAGKKFKVLNIVKCGQNAPREFRICVDFEMI
jgi:tRNA (guanine37-N1)-methyltransferase